MIDTLTDDKGGWIRRDSPGSYTLHITEQHCCGLQGFGYGPDDTCPACDQGRTLSGMMKKAEARHKPIKVEVSQTWVERMAKLEDGCDISAGGAVPVPHTPWTKDWPSEPGWYWFYGVRSSGRFRLDEEQKPKQELCAVRVVVAGNDKLIHLSQGVPIYKAEGAKGKWTQMVVPEIPK